jgi:hypothetical protein
LSWILDTNGDIKRRLRLGRFQGGAIVLPDAALRSIAVNLAALRLDPLTHMRVVAALAPTLLETSNPAKNIPENIPAPEIKADGARKPRRRIPNRSDSKRPPPELAGRKKAAPKRKLASARNGKPLPGTPIEIAFEGETYSRTALAELLANRFERSASAIIHMLRTHDDDPAAVVAFYEARSKEDPAQAKSPWASPPAMTVDYDDAALSFLQERLAGGPVLASVVDDEVDSGRLQGMSVERAREQLSLVGVRINGGRGSRLHWATPAQAKSLRAETAVA